VADLHDFTVAHIERDAGSLHRGEPLVRRLMAQTGEDADDPAGFAGCNWTAVERIAFHRGSRRTGLGVTKRGLEFGFEDLGIGTAGDP